SIRLPAVPSQDDDRAAAGRESSPEQFRHFFHERRRQRDRRNADGITDIDRRRWRAACRGGFDEIPYQLNFFSRKVEGTLIGTWFDSNLILFGAKFDLTTFLLICLQFGFFGLLEFCKTILERTKLAMKRGDFSFQRL